MLPMLTSVRTGSSGKRFLESCNGTWWGRKSGEMEFHDSKNYLLWVSDRLAVDLLLHLGLCGYVPNYRTVGMIKTASCSKSTRLLSAGESSRFPALSDFNFDLFLFSFFTPFWNSNEHDERDGDPSSKRETTSE